MIVTFVSVLAITLIITILPIALPPLIPQYILNNLIYVTLLRVPIITLIVILVHFAIQDVRKK